MIHIVQDGSDGFGHQLHGLFSCMILHNTDNYYFDAFYFKYKNFKFDHIDIETAQKTKEYLIAISNEFINYYKLSEIKYQNNIFSHEIYNIPTNYDPNTLYRLDNAYYFEKIPNYNKIKSEHNNNIAIIKNFFINDKLPKNRLKQNNVVIHIRGGDALIDGRNNVIRKYNNQILELLPILFKKYKNYTYYIHSDDNVDFLIDLLNKNNIEYFHFAKSTNIMEVISDFIHSDIFIMGVSSLSTICSFLGEHELIICNDDYKQNIDDKCIKISKFIKNE
jgi:hypothetical protein